MRGRLLALALVMALPSPAAAEWQLRPFLGFTFGGKTTFIDLEQAVDGTNVVVGVGGVLLGEVLGVEVDLGHAPGFFEAGDQVLVVGSSVTTLTGNIVIAMPRRLSAYSLRPYFVGGGGLMRVRIDPGLDVLKVARTLAALDIGGGVTGFLTDQIGLNWDIRYVRSAGSTGDGDGVSFGAEQLSFWRANMAVAFRY